MELVTSLFNEWGGLIGIAAAISMVIGLMKTFGWVKDGQSQTWSAGLNLLGLAAFFYVKTAYPNVDMQQVDTAVGNFVNVATIVISYVVSLGVSKLTYVATKNVPLIGKSFTK